MEQFVGKNLSFFYGLSRLDFLIKALFALSATKGNKKFQLLIAWSPPATFNRNLGQTSMFNANSTVVATVCHGLMKIKKNIEYSLDKVYHYERENSYTIALV